MSSVPNSSKEYDLRKTPKTAGALFESLQKMGAFGLWSDIPESEDSLTVARKIREAQKRF
jgi:hypothetical protein